WRSHSCWRHWPRCPSTLSSGRARTPPTRPGCSRAPAGRTPPARLAYCGRCRPTTAGRTRLWMDARILLVEDDPSIREVTAIGLRAAGFTVETAGDGREGLDRFEAGAF